MKQNTLTNITEQIIAYTIQFLLWSLVLGHNRFTSQPFRMFESKAAVRNGHLPGIPTSYKLEDAFKQLSLDRISFKQMQVHLPELAISESSSSDGLEERIRNIELPDKRDYERSQSSINYSDSSNPENISTCGQRLSSNC